MWDCILQCLFWESMYCIVVNNHFAYWYFLTDLCQPKCYSGVWALQVMYWLLKSLPPRTSQKHCVIPNTLFHHATFPNFRKALATVCGSNALKLQEVLQFLWNINLPPLKISLIISCIFCNLICWYYQSVYYSGWSVRRELTSCTWKLKVFLSFKSLACWCQLNPE